MSNGMDDAVAQALEHAACELEATATSLGTVWKLTEARHLKPAFRDGLVAAGLSGVHESERKIRFSAWEPPGVKGRLGGVDVIVSGTSGYRAFFELKWASTKHELGWTLWDIYKLAAGRIEYGVSAYAVVGAPTKYWSDPLVACAELYRSGTWDSAALFHRYEAAWLDLLGGGTARPAWVPASINTELVASRPMNVSPPWELRALRIEVDSTERLPFSGDWPASHHAALEEPGPRL